MTQAQTTEALAQECADYATSLRSTAMVIQLEGRSAPASFVRAAELFERASARITQLERMNDHANLVVDAAKEHIAQLEAELAQLRQAVPDGWRTVPLEPDAGMKRAAQKASMEHSPHKEWLDDEWPDVMRMWVAMLAASPTPPARKGLTHEQIHKLFVDIYGSEPEPIDEFAEVCRRVEAAHGIQGEGNDN